VEFYAPLVGTRHIDPKNGLTYQTVDIKVTPNRDIVAWRRRITRGVLQDTSQEPFHVHDIYTYTQRTLKDGMLNERHSVDRSPSDISHRVAPEPVVNARNRPLGSESPMIGEETVHLGTNGSLRNKRRFSNMQQNVNPRGSATPPVPNRSAQNERNMNTEYNLRRPEISPAPAKETAERSKRFRATTHLASAIASGDQFTSYAVEDIKASLSESESQGNKYDDRMRDDYIPPNRKMMLLCKQKDKWLAAEEDELRSFAVNNVMTKNSRLPDNGKALPL
jgi:hypothetical protein